MAYCSKKYAVGRTASHTYTCAPSVCCGMHSDVSSIDAKAHIHVEKKKFLLIN